MICAISAIDKYNNLLKADQLKEKYSKIPIDKLLKMCYNTDIIIGLYGGVEMTDKELKKLGRAELLEIMYELRRQLDKALLENEELRTELSGMKDSALMQTNEMVKRLYMDKYGELPEAEEPETEPESAEEQSDEREEQSSSDG